MLEDVSDLLKIFQPEFVKDACFLIGNRFWGGEKVIRGAKQDFQYFTLRLSEGRKDQFPDQDLLRSIPQPGIPDKIMQVRHLSGENTSGGKSLRACLYDCCPVPRAADQEKLRTGIQTELPARGDDR